MERIKRSWESVKWTDTKNIKNAINAELSGQKLKIDFNVYLCSKYEVDCWRIIRGIYQYFRDQLGEKCYHKHLYIEYDSGAAPYRLTGYIQGTESIVIWSYDESDQEKSKEIFENFFAISSFYHHIADYLEDFKKIRQKKRLQDELSERGITEEELKAERRKKWEQNDPDSPAARNQRARRHLERLGYTLHKSRKMYGYTADDRGQYKIVNSSGETVLGNKFDATLEAVEQFYTAEDKKRWSGRYAHKEEEKPVDPQLVKREQKATVRLKKFGFVLKIDEHFLYSDDVREKVRNYTILDTLNCNLETTENISEIEEICQKLKEKGFKERESPVKQKKVLHQFEEKITRHTDIWVYVGFNWESKTHNKGYQICNGDDEVILGENYSLTLDDVAAYINAEGKKDWQRENALRYQLRKKGYALRKKRKREPWERGLPWNDEYQIINPVTKEVVAGADATLSLEQAEQWILQDSCLEKTD